MVHWFTYCIEEAAASLWRQRVSVVLAVCTIAAALFVLGGFLLVTVNLDRAVSRWSAAAEFSIYLDDEISQEQRVALNARLGSIRPSRRASTSRRPTPRPGSSVISGPCAGLADAARNPLPRPSKCG